MHLAGWVRKQPQRPRRTGRRFRWVIEWPQRSAPCTPLRWIGRDAERRCGRECGSPQRTGAGTWEARNRRSFSHEWIRGMCVVVCQGSFSAFWRKVPRPMLARARNEAKTVWMQESYLSLPVFSSNRRQVTRKPVGGFVLSVRCEVSPVGSRFSFDCTFCFLSYQSSVYMKIRTFTFCISML